MEMQSIGAILSGLACVGLGYRIAGRQEEQIRAYWQLRQSLSLLAGEIERGASLAEALSQCSVGGDSLWLRMAEALSERRESLDTVWRREIEREKSYLQKDEEAQLLSLGQVLGIRDREGCCRSIRAVEAVLAAREEERTRMLRQKKQLHQKLGWMAGLLVCVVFF